MQVSTPNAYGVLEETYREIVASRGRAYAAIKIALREVGQYCYGLEMQYSYGGFAFPIDVEGDAFNSLSAARTAALDELLRHWHTPFSSDPSSVQEELRSLREQVESHIQQPSLF